MDLYVRWMDGTVRGDSDFYVSVCNRYTHTQHTQISVNTLNTVGGKSFSCASTQTHTHITYTGKFTLL